VGCVDVLTGVNACDDATRTVIQMSFMVCKLRVVFDRLAME
jgi:hypothetical protein